MDKTSADQIEGASSTKVNRKNKLMDVGYLESNEVVDPETQVAGIQGVSSKDMQFFQLQNGKDLLKGVALFIASLVIDVGIPLGIYYGMKGHTSIIAALFVSSIPPLLFVIGKFIYYRKVDVMGCLFVLGFVLSGIFALATGDPRLVLLRDSSITCVTGLCFLLTLIPIRTKRMVIMPLSFLIFAQMLGGTERIEWKDEEGVQYSLSKSDWMWTNVRWVRIYGYVSTATWGTILMCEFIVKVIMIKSSLTMDQIVSQYTGED